MKTLLFSLLAFLGMVATLFADPLIKFDDLPTNNVPVPNGYHLLGWTNIYYFDGIHYANNPSGLQAGVVSGNFVAYGGNGFTASIAGGMFDFLSAYLTSAFNDNLQLE